MKYYVTKEEAEIVKNPSHTTHKLLSEKNGCVKGCCTGFSVWTATEYMKFGAHDDQEGFFIVEGTGWAKVGDEEIKLKPYVSFIAPAGVQHCLKKDPDSPDMKVFWFHAAVK